MSCTTTKMAISTNRINATNNEIEKKLNESGWEASGSQQNNTNEIFVSGVSYSQYSGYGSALSNNYMQNITYLFTDTNNNTMEYTLQYKLEVDRNNTMYTDHVSITNCKASRNYNEICGVNGLVPLQINALNNNPTQEVVVYDRNKSITLGTTISIIGGVIIGILPFLLIL